MPQNTGVEKEREHFSYYTATILFAGRLLDLTEKLMSDGMSFEKAFMNALEEAEIGPHHVSVTMKEHAIRFLKLKGERLAVHMEASYNYLRNK